MSAQAASWNDWSASNTSREPEEDKWHVALAPNEVKIVSLEQLDDLFRLSIVDAETPVWQAGMGDWLPLRVIAGIDEEDEEEAELATRHAQPRPVPKPPSPKAPVSTRRPAPPQRRPQEMMALAATQPQHRPAQIAALAATQPASFYPTPARAPAPASFYPTAVSVAPAAAPFNFAAPVAAQQFNSVRPLVVSHAPPAPQRGGGFGRFLVGFAVLAGAAVSLYRNDVLRDAAHSAHQDALYARLEGALGGPAFDTLRNLDQSAGSQNAAAMLGDDLTSAHTASASDSPTAAAAPLTTQTAVSTAATGANTPATTPPVVSLESLTPEKKAGMASAPTPAAAPAPSPAPAPVAARPVAVATRPAPVAASVSHAAPAPRPAKSAPAPKPEKPMFAPDKPESQMNEREKLNAAIGRSMMSAPPSGKSKSKSKASEYDPLNPTL